MSQNITLKQASIAYLEKLKAQGKTEKTLYTYGKDLEQVQAFWGPEKPLFELTKPQVGKFLKSETLLQKPNGKERAPQTIDKTVRVLRMFLIWAQGEGLIPEAPLPKDMPLGRSQKEGK